MTRLSVSLKSVSGLNSSTELMGTDWRLLRSGGRPSRPMVSLTLVPVLFLADVTIRRHRRRRHVRLQRQKVRPTQIEFCAVSVFLSGFFPVQINSVMIDSNEEGGYACAHDGHLSSLVGVVGGEGPGRREATQVILTPNIHPPPEERVFFFLVVAPSLESADRRKLRALIHSPSSFPLLPHPPFVPCLSNHALSSARRQATLLSEGGQRPTAISVFQCDGEWG